MRINIDGTANVQGITTALARVNAALAETQVLADKAWAATSKGGLISPQAGNALRKAQLDASKAFDSAMASSKAWTTQQFKLTNATDEFVRSLNKQKLSMADIKKSGAIAKQAYNEQIRMQRAFITTADTAEISAHRSAVSLHTPMKAIQADLDNVGNKLIWQSALWKSWGTQLQNQGKNMQWAGRQITVGLTLPILALGAAAGKMAYDLDKGLTSVAKVYNTQANQFSNNVDEQKKAQTELSTLRKDSTQLAIDMAKKYGASLTDTMAAEEALAASGKSGNELIQSTSATLRAATIGQIDNQKAVTATIAMQSIFRMSAKETADSWNYMNSVENQTSLTMADFTDALPIAGGAIKLLGGNIQDMGTLLTAMKSRGYDATESANALKSSINRVYNASKPAKEMFASMTGKSLPAMTKGSKTLMEMLMKLEAATKDLSKNDKVQLFGKLFGTYQVAKMSAALDGLNDVKNGVGQTSEAFKIGQESTQDWANVANREIASVQNSVSGKLKRAFETIKIEMAQFGQPFLKAATVVLKMVSAVFDAFNSLPSVIKNVAAGGLFAAALVGPLVMVMGLLKNFRSLFVLYGAKLGDAIGRSKAFGGTLEILTAEELAQKKAADQMAKSLAEVSNSAHSAEQAVIAMAQAMEYAQKVERGSIDAWMNEEHKRNMMLKQEMELRAQIQAEAIGMNINYDRIAAGQKPIAGAALASSVGKTTGAYQANQAAAAAATTAAAAAAQQRAAALAAEEQRISAEKNAKANKVAAAAAGEASRNAKVMKVSMAAGSASMLAMFLPGNEFISKLANATLAFAIVAPILSSAYSAVKLKLMVTSFKSIAGSMKAAAASSRIAAAAQELSGVAGARRAALGTINGAQVIGPLARAETAAVETAAVSGGWKTIGTRIGAASTALLGVSGLTLGIGAGVLAVGAGLWLWHNHLEQVRKDQLALEARTRDAGDTWTKALTGVERKYKSIASLSYQVKTNGYVNPYQKAEDFKKSDEGKKYIDDYNNTDNTTQKQFVTMSIFRNVMQATGGDTKAAEEALKSFFIALGEGYVRAGLDASKFAGVYSGTITSVKDQNGEAIKSITGLNQTLLDTLFKDIDGAHDPKKAIETFVKNFDDGVASAVNGTERGSYVRDLVQSYTSGISDMLPKAIRDALKSSGMSLGDFSNLVGTPAGGMTTMDKAVGMLYGGNATNYKEALNNGTQDTVARIGVLGKTTLSVQQLMDSINNLDPTKLQTFVDKWNEITKQLLAANPNFNQNIKTPDQLLNDPNIKLLMAGNHAQQSSAAYEYAFKQAKGGGALANTAWNFGGGAMSNGNLPKTNKQFAEMLTKVSGTKAEALKLLNAMRDLAGLQPTNFLSDWMNEIPTVSKGLHGLKLDADMLAKLTPMAQGAWTGAMSSVMGDAFSAAQAAQSTGLSNRQQDASDGLDKKWEHKKDAMTKYYDGRIKKINDQIKAEQAANDLRQKIFDAEQTRLSRLRDLANSNSDIVIATSSGQLDQAAKLQNDQNVMTSGWASDDANAAAAGTSQSRQDLLQKRADQLDKEKTKALDHLAKIEAAEKKSLARRQAAQTAYEQKKQADQKRTFDLMMSEMQTLGYMDQKSLTKRIGQIETKYGEVGAMFKGSNVQLAKDIRTQYYQQMTMGINQVKSDRMWAELGKTVVSSMILKPLGFTSVAQFTTFMATGKLVADKKPTPKNKSYGVTTADQNNNNLAGGNGGRHRGGMVNQYGGSRYGFQGDLKSHEQSMTVEDGEFFVNKHAVRKPGVLPLLHKINSGGGLGAGPIPALPAASARGLMMGAVHGVKNAFAQRIMTNVVNSFSGGGNDGSGTEITPAFNTHGASQTGKNAMSWAASKIGEAGWHNKCLSFVRQSLGAPGGVYDAKASWAQAQHRHSMAGQVPPGVPVFWNNSPNGHVVLTTGNGGVISTDHPAYDQPGKSTIASVSKWIGMSPAGWSADINGKNIYPSLSVGAFTMSDGMARLHKKEAVLTAPMTEDFKRGVKNFADGGNSEYNVELHFHGANTDEKIVKKVIKAIKDIESTKPRSSKVGEND